MIWYVQFSPFSIFCFALISSRGFFPGLVKSFPWGMFGSSLCFSIVLHKDTCMCILYIHSYAILHISIYMCCIFIYKHMLHNIFLFSFYQKETYVLNKNKKTWKGWEILLMKYRLDKKELSKSPLYKGINKTNKSLYKCHNSWSYRPYPKGCKSTTN